MAFFDKLKDAKNTVMDSAGNIANSAKNSLEKAKEEYEAILSFVLGDKKDDYLSEIR